MKYGPEYDDLHQGLLYGWHKMNGTDRKEAMKDAAKGQHTPGPWDTGGERHANIVYGLYDAICQVYGVPMNCTVSEISDRYAEGLANARLIAAAPDLLEALKDLVGLLTEANITDRTGIVSRARAAIKKAEGEG